MSNILEQIQELKEQFSSLFEVEDLGQPAIDVPPSQNKIKKDRKTKDGKVEVVSVEDELFPYNGNKREQYRQKIIATINDMIQGKATLEDLLQIVRQKKAPLKEAMEVLECMINEVSDKWKEQAQQKAYSNLKNAQIDKDNKVIAFRLGNPDVGEDDVKDAIKNVQKHAGRAAKLDNAIIKHDLAKMEGRIKPANEPLKEAIELMEEVINEVSVGALARATENNFNKRREVAKASTENAKRAYDNYEKQSKEHPEEEEALYKATSKLGNIAHKDREKASHANDLANLNLPKDSKVPANKLFNAADKTYTNRGKEVDKALEKGKGRGDKEFDSSMKKYARAVDLAVADPVVSRRTNEALELVENLYGVIQKQPKEKRAKLIDKYNTMKQKEGAGTYDLHQKMLKHKSKQEKGQEKTEERSEGALKKYLDTVKDHSESTPSMYQFEALKEAIKILELFDRPDLLDEIDKALGSPVRKKVNKMMTPKKEIKASCKENFDNSQKIGYNIEEAIRMIEAVINEVSDKKHRNLVNELQDGIRRAEELKEMVATPTNKKDIDDIIITQRHRLAVSREKREDKVTNRAKKDEIERKEKRK